MSDVTASGVRPVGVAVLGMGTVGSEVIRYMTENAEALAARIGAPLVLRGVAVRDLTKDRGLDPDLLTADPASLVSREDVDIVVELMGGIDLPRPLLLEALRHGKAVVTANKALLAEYTDELAEAADSTHTDLYFEAAVAGAIPVIGPLRRSMAGDQVERVVGIVNGTTNYILSEMGSTGADYSETLAEASRLGYAEADPTADVEGYDAAAKAAILASIAFHSRVTAGDVYREGISRISPDDFESARDMDCTIKLLAICEKLRQSDGSEAVSARVYPALLPNSHPLAAVNGAFNAVVVEAQAAGRLMFYGQGAGGAPTASAVLGDMVAAARNKAGAGRAPGESTYAALPVANMDEISTRYHVRMRVADKPGVLAQVATEFSTHGVSIAQVRQTEVEVPDAEAEDVEPTAEITVLTHLATERALADTVAALSDQDAVTAITSVIRLEGVDTE
ncbi:homoserine dehydrogenase [Dietzia cinnamea]|uniref:Homoserine dehydrogenase n=1 Tax=Dietzia cinnamea TaxID=321318 RepID=A0ABV3YLE2_9ACTN|nr:homoserine dehydrogenase [Dietzia cinnamea]MCT1639087.1 homoserine dehydrogenase [Dietzia cinnamea]MCT1884212.1 homoserine dehydrogenase [Dietzia cinnamea]MCT2173595.1 homoserine dehydrogenase [Dietzia cinnamea]